jgi:hypothetical protein
MLNAAINHRGSQYFSIPYNSSVRKTTFITAFILATVSNLYFLPSTFAGTTYSFTNASVTGSTGPTQVQINSAYTGTTLAGLVTINTAGIQEWTVPTSGTYSITMAGAKGGGTNGGRGARIYGEFNLTQGQILKIIVGQMGSASSNYGGGGGGGSFVWLSTSISEPLIAAGGGGGQGGGGRSAIDASITTSGTAGTPGGNDVSGAWAGAGGTGGNPGQTYDYASNSWDAAAGAGWKGNSTNATQYTGSNQNFAYSPANGGMGGLSFSAVGNNSGGFGGGGGAGGTADSPSSVGAGGGGYSGGGNGSNDSSVSRGAGGGGGSYNSGSNVSSTPGSNSSHGYVTITQLTAITANFNSFALAGNVTNATFRTAITINASVDVSAKVTFKQGNLFISGCRNKVATGSGSVFTASCTWKPSQRGSITLSATATPIAGGNMGYATPVKVAVLNRVGTR